MKEKRQKEILDIIETNENEIINLKKLSAKFNVSEMTIRRDLNELENSGLIKKLFGGQIIRLSSQNEPNYKLRIFEQIKEKEHIANIVKDIISDNDTIFLDIGSTCFYIAQRIKHRNIFVATTWIPNIIELSKGYDIKIFNIGGNIDKKELQSYGTAAYERISNFYFNKAIIGVGGFNSNGIYDFRLEIVELKKKILKCSKEVILVADHTKFGRFAPILICKFEDHLIHKLVTSDINKINKDTIDLIKSHGIELID
ncbi:MAG: DeoR/GlpR family transcriptional regulator [Candidatus Caldatribacteriota bacterium]